MERAPSFSNATGLSHVGNAAIMKFTTRIGVTIASLLITSSANVVLGRDLPSPDSTLMATISAVGGAKGESQLEIRLLTGEILIKKSYASEDGQHGEIVDQVEWTPDSQFLV